MLGNTVAADVILRFKAQLAETNDINAIRLVESQAAKTFWSQWADVPIRWVRKDQDRVPAHWKRFMSRMSPITHSPRLATNPANACMNLLHTLCEAECRIALIATGLDPEIGLMHRDAPGRSSLANDLQEILRPMVDSFVLNWMQTELFRKADFWEDKNGNCRLMSHLCAKLSETSPIWGRAVAPVAEWVAPALWSSIRKSANKSPTLPTRLTQRRRSESRGNEFAMRLEPTPNWAKICEICGAERVKNRYCKSCAVEVARENMAQVALIGHSKPRTAKVRARISQTLSDHAVANSWWDPSGLRKWLTEKCYREQIQPRLRDKKIREIAEAMLVSEPYAALVRSGRRRPHPRHWKALAELAGHLPNLQGWVRESN